MSNSKQSQPPNVRIKDRIEDDIITLNGCGQFPKKLLILQPGKRLYYKLVKSKSGNFLLNK